MGVKEYHIVVLIFIFLITNEVEQVLSKQTSQVCWSLWFSFAETAKVL